jgi:DNA-binding IclR family transcriptional regulator
MPKPSSDRTEKSDGVAAVDRAFKIVSALEANAKPLGLADLARETGMYKSTLLRLLASLERNTLVVRRPDSKYALGQFAFRLGRAFETTYHLKECVVPVLEWLVTQDTESPSFSGLIPDTRRWIA